MWTQKKKKSQPQLLHINGRDFEKHVHTSTYNLF
jgi:hypothetical protein